MTRPVRRGTVAHIRHPVAADADRFIAAARRSRRLHHPWVSVPHTAEAFDAYLRRGRRANQACFLICRNTDGEIVGAANLSEIVRGVFQSAFLSYYAFTPHARKGYLREGLELVVTHAFEDLGLHRVQANVRPENVASTQLLHALGFRFESRSPRYLFLDGDWRDHFGFVRTHEDRPPPIGGHDTVTLHELDDENWRTLFDIEVMDGQRRWVRDVPWYLAWSLASARWQPVVIRARERTIGFAMWGRAHEDGSYWIGGFVIDRREQRKGYGRAALTVLIEALRSKPGCRRIKLTYLPDNQAARALSASAGFEETGEIVDGEIVARVDVVPRRPRRKA